ncbi:DNA translocase FtsK [Tundrisphaera sp. TA3]|uniref:DNA translocase FtsK n=1 Tax=Tundrisphaera sp. TA3 TaxID=3435775 RepID=UPI003EB81626
MLDRRRWARHGWAGSLLFAVSFLALCLIGYDPADPPGSAASPANDPATNPCGPVGAAIAHVLFTSVGWASFLVLYALLVADWLLYRRRRVAEPAQRLIGLGMVLLVLAAAVQKLAPDLPRSAVVGSGGYAGALAVAFLEGQFGLAGLALILSGIGLVGLANCHEYLFLWPIQEIFRAMGKEPAHGGERPAGHEAVGTTLMLPEPGYATKAAARLDPPPVNRGPIARAVAAPAAMAHTEIVPARPAARAVPAPVPAPVGEGFQLPPFELLEVSSAAPVQENQAKIHAKALLLEKTLLEFGCSVRVVQIDTGPVITQFEIELEAGLRVAKINSVANDLAIALAVPNIRIVSPIPNKTTVGIEVPNDRRTMVRLGEVVSGVQGGLHKLRIPMFLGKDVKGSPLAFDLADMPHLLIAGRTGTGKSVCLNAMIISILMTKSPEEVQMILIDPKKVELSQFKKIPHLMHPVVTDEKKAESLLAWACDKMDERYGFLARAEVRNIQGYNELTPDEIMERLRPEDEEEQKRIPLFMPYIVIIIDEMGDLIAQVGKEVETHIVRLAQKARAAGIHLILATQKPTVDVITGLIKSNLPARIAFQVASRNDSRVVLDEMGADKLLGNGDMLFLVPGTSNIIRAQGTYVSDNEVNRVCQYLSQFPQHFSRELAQLQVGGGAGKDRDAIKARDELYEPAIEIVIREGRGSTSLLQRAMQIGYGRAARLIDFMAEDGIVGEFKSGSAREVLYTWEDWEALKNGGNATSEAA